MSSSSDSATPAGWTHTSEYRHQCLVRFVLAMRVADRERALQWLRGAKHPGLEEGVRRQWALGNRGAWGDWRADPGR